jgi:hypothetical protein
MKPKNIIGVALLLFVVGSVAFMAIRDGGEDGLLSPTPITGVDPELIVYYFDADFRCETCDNLKAYTLEALETHFAEELKTGTIAWQIHNTDRPVNEHFVSKYSLYSKSVVLVRMQDGKPEKSENLKRIWDLVYDKPAYIEYIRTSTQDLLELAQ